MAYRSAIISEIMVSRSAIIGLEFKIFDSLSRKKKLRVE